MADDDVPPPPSLIDRVRQLHAKRLTVTEEAYLEFSARLEANGGRLRALTAEELAQPVPPPPDFNAMVMKRALEQRCAERRKK